MQKQKKVLAVLLVFLMAFGLLTANHTAAAASPQEETIAEWDITEAPATNEIPATGGTKMDGAVLTAHTKLSTGETPAIQWDAESGLFVNGWKYQQDMQVKSWEIKLSTKGYTNIKMSALTASDSDGPKNVIVGYSCEGGAPLTYTQAGYFWNTTSLENYMGDNLTFLPFFTADKQELIIRISLTGLLSVDGGSVEESAYSYIRDIRVTGTPIESTPEVDKGELEDAIDDAQAKLDAAEVGNEPGQYPQEAVDTFGGAIDDAKAVKDGAEATQDEIDAAVAALNAAVAAFEAAVIPEEEPGMTIAEARALPIGTQVTIRGVVSRSIPSSAGNQGNCTVFIEDGTAGIGIFNMSAFSPTTYAPGTTLIVSGSVGEYNGLLEIQYDAVVTVDESVPVIPLTPKTITVAELMTGNYQGQFVKIEAATLINVSTNANHTILQEGTSTTMRCLDPSGTLTDFASGDVIDVVGVAGIYGGSAQLLVQDENDISLAGGSGDVGFVSASPTGGVIQPNELITLKTATQGATIKYSINDGEYQIYTAPFALATLPATVKAYVEKNGVQGSISTFEYLGSNASIAEVRNLPVGTRVTVTGVVTRSIPSSSGSQNNCTVFIQDETAGIGIYKSYSFSPNTYPAGTTLTVTGPLSEYNGLLEIIPDSLSDIVKGETVEVPAPEVITVADLMTGNYQGEFVKITGATLTSVATDSNHRISQVGSSTTLRCTGASTLNGFQVNDVIDVVGVAGIYGGSAQLLVQNESDINLTATEPEPAEVTAVPEGGVLEPGDTVALSTATEGAVIKYSVNDGAYQTYTEPFAITELPATVKAYAEKNGVTGPASTFTYTAKQAVGAVHADPAGGNVEIGSTVTLTCETEGATIKYSMDDGVTYQGYTGPITVTDLPFVIKVYAVKEGFVDGPVATFTYERTATGVNRAGITVEPVTVLGKDRIIVFRVSAENLRDVWTLEGTVKIEDTENFTIQSIKQLYTGENTVFQKTIGDNGDTAYFLLGKVGGMEDADSVDIAEIRVQRKEGSEADTLEAVLDSFHMYRGYAEDHTAEELDVEISNSSAVTRIYEGGILGDLNNDGEITGLDVTISLTLFGLTSEDEAWYPTGAWRADFDGNGLIDITDISKLAYRVAHFSK